MPRFYHNEIPEEDMTELVGQEMFNYQINKNKNMFTLDWVSIKRALVQGVLTGIVAGVAFILKAGSIFGLDLKSLTDVVVLAGLATLPALLTSLLTTEEGKVAGAIQVE